MAAESHVRHLAICAHAKANYASVTMLRLTSTQMLVTMLHYELQHAGFRAHGAASSVLLMYRPPVVFCRQGLLVW